MIPLHQQVLGENDIRRYSIHQLNALGGLDLVYKEKHNVDGSAKGLALALARQKIKCFH